MDTKSLDAVIERLNLLEADNRLWKRITIALLGVMAILLIAGTNLIRAPREVSAEKFVLRDDRGRPRALLSLKAAGTPALSLLDEGGKDQVVLRALAGGTSALEYFEGSSLRMVAASQAGVGSYFSLLNRNKRTRSEMFAWEDGTSGVTASRDLRAVTMQVTPEGDSRVGLADKRGQERFGVRLLLDGTVVHHDETPKTQADDLSISPEPKSILREPAPKTSKAVEVIES